MRLICPNCGAQYEVPDDVIPEGGRDVQCSNCGHTWFEQPGASAAAEAEAMDQAEAGVEAQQSEPEPEPQPEPGPQQDSEKAWEDPGEAAQDPAQDHDAGDDGHSEEPEAPAEALERKPIDPAVADVLREETNREEALRAREAESLESQPDLGIDDLGAEEAEPGFDTEGHTDPDADEVPQDRRAREASDRMARLRGQEAAAPADAEAPEAAMGRGPAAAAAAAAATVASGTRKDMLPDIEEINSTLRPDPDAPGAEAEATPAKRSGFRRGFLWVIILVLLAVMVYILAPRIIEMMPGVEGPVTAYVEWVDGMRLWLDGQVQGLLGDAGPAETPPASPSAAPSEAPSVGSESPDVPEAPESTESN